MANAPSPIDVRLSQLSDEELDALLGTYDQSNRQLADLSDEELAYLFQPYEAEGRNAAQPPAVAPPTPPPLTTGEAFAGGARELAGGALFEFADEAEAAARAPFSSQSYDELLRDIRQSRARFGEEYPGTATALNVAGGVGSMFVPGVNVLGRGVQAATGISRLASPAARVAASGALAGGVAGLGSGETPEERLTNLGTGAALGAGLGAGFYGAGRGAQWLKGVAQARRGQQPEDAAQIAARLVNQRLAQSGMDPDTIRDLAEMSARNGVPFTLGIADPRLASLSETVLQSGGEGRADLAERLFQQQAGAPERVQQRLRQSIPTPDYFASEERIIETLRNNAKQAYGAVNDVEVRDPVIMDILNAPDIKSAYGDALANVEREKVAAQLRGEDPSQYDLRKVFEPILDEQGALVGLSDTPTTVPDIKTLNQIKIALDRRIDSLYSSGKGGEATALKNLRNAFVNRLDDVGPAEYRAARQQYKGDIEIKEALETGRDANKLRWQEVRKLTKDYSPGELQAFRTGYVQRLMQGFEDTSRRRNFAREIIDNQSQRKKLEAIMDPGEFQVLEAALRREADNFDAITRATGGSQTAGRVAARQEIEDQIAGGNVEDAVNLLLNPTPGSFARSALNAARRLRDANVSRATYTQLARLLRAGEPDEIEAALRSLEEALPAQRAAEASFESGATRAGAGAATTIAPSPEMEREILAPPGELVIPDIEAGAMPSGLEAMPAGEPAVSGVGGPSSEGATNVWDALKQIMPDLQMGFADGSIIGQSGRVMEAPAVAEALGIPVAAWLKYAGGQ